MKKATLLTATLIFMVSVVAVAAQTFAPAPVVIDTKPLIEQLVPYVVALAGAVITAIGGIAVAWFNQWAKKHGVEIDDSHRDALLQSLKNVAAGGIAKGAVKIEENGKVTIPPGILSDMAKDIIENRAPDAVGHFALTPEQVEQKIVEQIPQIMTPGASK